MFTEDQIAGARSLLQDGLHLRKNATLLLLYQNTFSDTASCIVLVAQELGIRVDKRLFRRGEFIDKFPEYLKVEQIVTFGAFPDGIILLMEWSEATTSGRLRFLVQLMNTSYEWRIASMPGVDLVGLASCIVDFDQIERDSYNTFVVMATSDVAIIETSATDGQTDSLTIGLRYDNPIISTGKIETGSWGNFPSGETFIVPEPYRASGWITLRGSFPNYVMGADEWVRFELRKGRIRRQSITASSGKLEERFASLFFGRGIHPKSKNTNALAELGVGTNNSVKALTGKPIFDEKKRGTFHLSFGRNDQFLGPLQSKVHHDLTCSHGTLIIGDTPVIRDGVFCLTQKKALPQLSSFSTDELPSSAWSPGVAWHVYDDGSELTKLYVMYSSVRDSEVKFSIAQGKMAVAAKNILDLIYEMNTATLDDIIKRVAKHINREDVIQIIHGLERYQLIQKVQ